MSKWIFIFQFSLFLGKKEIFLSQIVGRRVFRKYLPKSQVKYDSSSTKSLGFENVERIFKFLRFFSYFFPDYMRGFHQRPFRGKRNSSHSAVIIFKKHQQKTLLYTKFFNFLETFYCPNQNLRESFKSCRNNFPETLKIVENKIVSIKNTEGNLCHFLKEILK